MPSDKLTKSGCIELLRAKQSELDGLGIERFPKRADFSESEVVAIKAFLGPWPRALEAAGLKETRSDDRLEKNREKHIRTRIRRREEKLRGKDQ